MGGSLRKKLTAPEKVGNEVYDFLLKASPSCDEMLKVCTFQGHPFNCCEAFEPVMTDFGLCYSFNKLPSEIIFTESTHKPYPGRKYPPGAVFWNPDDGYPVDDKTRYLNKEKVFPVWSQVSGENTGLGVELYQNKSDWQRLCTGGYTGFQVKLTNAANFPVFTKVDERLALNRETSLMLTPLLLGSHPELANIPTRIRSCYFTDEKQLHFFKTYTYENCNFECTTLFTINECNCVPIEYMRQFVILDSQ
ncbi:pickpocket protein 28-like [Macrosteles quadrilineatus]|uniref:pickpocket protein 28-like n=1 Tax=Macrosteles quadrilineatus TaxID=74068 RepID=UPI0023E0D2E4|nr:pickpocket protein 28-like [Macrosteles quadrilineatus]